MTVTNDATVDWLWETQFMFMATSSGNGAVSGSSNGWYDLDSEIEVKAEPATYHHFLTWTGTVNSTSNPLLLAVDQAHSLTALFAGNLSTNGTPEWWLAQYGWTNDFDAAAVLDADHDGLLNWQEWEAGTDPTNQRSVLLVTTLFSTASGFVLQWPSVSNRMYGIGRATSLFPTGFEGIASNLPATPPVNVHTDQVQGINKAYYRITVEEP
jgi:hypothetical protein